VTGEVCVVCGSDEDELAIWGVCPLNDEDELAAADNFEMDNCLDLILWRREREQEPPA
jgi:hypothetical protein